jgi:hypothetical protein
MHRAREHAQSERSNDAAVILPTVSSWDTNFVILLYRPDGELEVETWLTPEAAREFYEERQLTRHNTLRQYRISEFNGSWCQFTEQRADLRWLATGEIISVHVAGLFPTWTDGILGEICWHEPAWANVPFDSASQADLIRVYESFEAAWQNGDVDAMLATFDDKTGSAIRIVETDGARRYRAIARTKDQLRDAWSSPEVGRVVELEMLHQCMTNWHVSTLHRLVVETSDRTVVRETARILPVGPKGTFLGELSYSMESQL